LLAVVGGVCCPRCKADLTVKEAVEILNGSGFQHIAKVQLPDGQIALVPAHLVNPAEVKTSVVTQIRPMMVT
jgi:hypothetical protein